ncbi:SAM-dependent methyltransferase [Bacillus sp. AGMB 02131]|uniref:SAM-dependent methyltransferase n=1 Tax=Peribacillus faecalis TaxID=2772559 RepID=A0A927CY91_9BACI|nr:SAM-dependent methyltransferase [Peribacillus faecalis]MBD3108130.1 SAM-dependent methyltransferase [Peribacillus faecalis]
MEKNIKNIIKAKIGGYVTYEEFIQLALYHPEYGYYRSNQAKIGAHGDFITSSNIGDVFGRTLGRWFMYIFRNFQLNKTIVELGAGTGKIAQAILSTIEQLDDDLYSQLNYTLVETSRYHQEEQKQRLKDYACAEFKSSLDDLNAVDGIIFSNEFFDAFPVRIVEKKQGCLYEAVVSIENDQLAEKHIPIQDQAILTYLRNQQIRLEEGQRIEIPLSMEEYYRKLSGKIKKGILLTIDYGYTNKEWTDPVHRNGSIRGYKEHQMITDVLKKPGEMDITTHIHWDCLRHCPSELGIETTAFLPQSEFLIRAGILEEFNEGAVGQPFSLEHKRNRAIRTLIDPRQISSSFQALIQTKNLEVSSDDLFAPSAFNK